MIYRERVAVPTLTWYGEDHQTRVHVMRALLRAEPRPSAWARFWSRVWQALRLDVTGWIRVGGRRAGAAA